MAKAKSSYTEGGTQYYDAPAEGESSAPPIVQEDPLYRAGGFGSAGQPRNRLQSQAAQYIDRAAENVRNRYGAEPIRMSTLSGASGQGQLVGLESAEALYGVTRPELGFETQDIVARRRADLEGTSPSATRLREERNRQVRMARAAGRTPAQQEAIKRQAGRDIEDVQYAREQKALTDYQKLIGKIISGTSQMEMGFAGLNTVGDKTVAPDLGGNTFGTVICTELFKQGYMDANTYQEDQKYGLFMKHSNPHVYYGYLYLASPIVRLMRKSPVFTKIISVPALKWADNMAGRKNLAGKLISFFGEKICGFIGKLKYGVNYAF